MCSTKHKPSKCGLVFQSCGPLSVRPQVVVCAHSLSDASGPTLVCTIDPPAIPSPSVLSFFLSCGCSLVLSFLVVSRPPVCIASLFCFAPWASGSVGVAWLSVVACLAWIRLSIEMSATRSF